MHYFRRYQGWNKETTKEGKGGEAGDFQGRREEDNGIRLLRQRQGLEQGTCKTLTLSKELSLSTVPVMNLRLLRFGQPDSTWNSKQARNSCIMMVHSYHPIPVLVKQKVRWHLLKRKEGWKMDYGKRKRDINSARF
jgi:hypothetical protein